MIDKIDLANTEFNQWKNRSFQERQLLFKNLADILDEQKNTYANIITTEMNKPISQALSEIEKSAMMTRFYANIDADVLAPEHIETDFNISQVHHTPLGVILGVMPWNFPFWQVLRFAVPTILAGNTIIVKHASICTQSGDAIEEAFLKAGFSKGVFQHLKVGHQDIETILKHPAVQGVSLTGSDLAGSSVASIAGREIKKSVLELGGSDAFIVLEDADLEQAAEVGALARLQNCGQTCVAAKRFIIHHNVANTFLELFTKAYQKYQPSDPLNPNTILSGMARKDLADELEQQYQKAITNGAEIIIPLERLSDKEFKPGLILVKKGNPILAEELFGPLGMVMIVQTDDEVLDLANDIPFGLGNSVWTKDQNKALDFALKLNSGTVAINSMTKSDPRLPFGGAKKSGYGTELSTLALKEFTYPKTVVGN
ncbi:NAD-dependent succinate-semialdehyde dehydrogenase [Riemerella anatipestifer]|uniref:NAD-dependent succinate-semialdehyde dehydrogenase n=1 Tax=Riemerella anatipestifer TaxID=34085 RepID=UPI00129E018D|nr:NAD-dependent succinate-semialdehyde dehydrogenase [Riemerella anatipestifer]MRM82768.1 NAD-dependent succinate-semialdehyde dehydrogenase [Riemerella anatipestifer]